MNNLPKTIHSPRFGDLQVDPERIIEFAQGLPGFEDCHRFMLLHPQSESPVYYILQSIDVPDVAFHIADPVQFGFSYELSLSDEEAAALKLHSADDAAVMVILYRDEKDRATPLRATLNAPLLLNLQARCGLQYCNAQPLFDPPQPT